MSEPKLISPMLDNFAMGEPISDHDGVRCCPAMEMDSDNKYIVKIISVPASQVQLNALLLTGAYQDQEAALNYFKDLADGIVQEAKVLQQLSQLEGFIPFEKWQIVPMEDGTGYDIYLLSSYRRTLEQHFRRQPMTHLGALNLGLDMCAALAVCRRLGYLYVDLKPGNIYISEGNEYRIGDLGFLKLDSLKYASLPEKYRSAYTAPEICDAFSSINTTIDIYAAGLILYQAYNDGRLPSMDGIESGEAFPAPAYADYEIAEIILKACAINPEDRWQDPIEMGQALVSYMQRNGANDTPIVPPAPTVENSKEEALPVEEAEAAASEDISAVGEETVIEAEAALPCEDDCGDPVEADLNEDEPAAEESVEKESTEDMDEDASDTAEEDYENLSFLDEESGDETAPEHIEEEIEYNEVSDEVSDILTQADELISYPTPDPVVAPEPIDIPMPPPLPIEDPQAEATDEETAEDAELTENASESTDDLQEQESSEDELDETEDEQPEKKRGGRWVIGLVVAILIAALLFVGFYYYQNYYLQPVSMVLDGGDGSLTVLVSSQIDESKLTVICSDTYGNQLKQSVVDGKAEFTDLAPNSAYTVKVVIDGFHRLTGTTSTGYTTPVQTNIVQFNAITGSEDGSVILNFTLDGPDASQWRITYSAPGEEAKSITFSGHMAALSQLTVGAEYAFTLESLDDLFLSGNTELTHTASKLVKAENLTISACGGGKLTATWNAPEDIAVSSWSVRCYNTSGFEKNVTTSECSITFDDIDTSTGYTIEVTAAGMSVSERAYVSDNAVTVSNFQADISDPNKLVLTWDANIGVSEKGWILLYTVDGSSVQEVACKDGNQAVISPAVPGASYQFTLQAADGADVFGGTHSCKTAEAEAFSGYSISAEDMSFYLCKRPNVENWDRHDLSAGDYVTDFAPNEKMSFLVRMRKVYDTVGGDTTIVYVVRDADGNLVNASSQATTWTDMWNYYYCELDIPYTPGTAGAYKISVYFNGKYVETVNFTITDT